MPTRASNKKQTTLTFAASKSKSSATSVKRSSSQSTGPNVSKKADSEVEEYPSRSSSSDDMEEVEEIAIPQKRKRHSVIKEEDDSVSTKRPELKVHDNKWRNLAVTARAVNGNLPLVHAESENKIHDILRVFDLSYEYGPCYGMSRIERWERANALGLNPPPGIREILLTRQGVEDPKYAQNVFFDQSERI